MPDPHFSDLILPQNEQPSISQLLASLKRTTLSIHNRLTSIRDDAAFVARVAAAYGPRPLVANERCGSWYIPPADKAAGAYFKSTDGHERAWKFSTRRLNLHLIEMVENNDGIIVVDSTRRGKRMPDALSTTLPVWCTVLNLALLPSHPSSPILHLPPSLPASTHSQITALLPQFLASLQALNLDLPSCLTKPLRPVWVTPDSSLPEPNATGASIFDDYRPVICCTASRRVVGSEMDEAGYVQGAGDDTENWACGLTPTVFWEHLEDLLTASEADLPDLIARLVSEKEPGKKDEGPRKELTRHISVCPLPLAADPGTPTECRIALTPDTTSKESWIKSPTYMQIGLGKSKLASRNMRSALPEICAFAAKFLARTPEDSQRRIVIACESGKDLSVGTALAISCYLFDEKGNFRQPETDTSFTKTLVKSRLGSIMTAYPEANPSRSTLQSVNSFLMDWRR
ncbi:tRNA A64-2'-O-ribosylphosphate transferase [Ilyonectria robusta]|uniref:tRNA A64-2'-O-ribosylphosphate transferase n=1 Tax=Ilyonectria robusta TaxID=1079257 RepID=UPI001E8CC343|nr:tRNA A64-2'-O-ribosylphosphate transferase [Ilyonectria robusta]KAH8733730.1 tRNA A64-2'-O-ribosylphosphate transferase [Ilyonectria robusta]